MSKVSVKASTPPTRFAGTLPVEGREGVKRARALHKRLTEPEAKLWIHLKRIKTVDTHFRKQVPIGPYIVDFACLRGSLIIEVDGAQHSFDQNRRYDAERTQFLNERGFTVLRFWNDEVLHGIDGVLDTIYAYLYGAADAMPRSFSRCGSERSGAPSSPSTGEVARPAGPEGVTASEHCYQADEVRGE